jgi:hypothetical protein
MDFPLLLSRPIFEPRTFVGIGVVMASLALIATRKGWRGWWNRWVLLVLAAAAWACITITYAYANAQAGAAGLESTGAAVGDPKPCSSVDSAPLISIVW